MDRQATNLRFEITIPVLNEEGSLVERVRTAMYFLSRSKITHYSVVIADNGSTDNTPLLAQQLATEFPDKVFFLKVPHKGVGLALRTSWMQSSSDIVGYMDLDLATDLSHLEQVYEIFTSRADVDIVNGSRLLQGSTVVNRKLLREIASRAFNLILKLLLGVKISDGMCGFKFARTAVAKELIGTGINTVGWIFSTEFLAKGEWSNKLIVEIPVLWKDDQKSKVKIIPLSLAYLKHIVKLQRDKKEWIKQHVREA